MVVTAQLMKNVCLKLAPVMLASLLALQPKLVHSIILASALSTLNVSLDSVIATHASLLAVPL